jgi:hypothetical protein
MLTTSSAGIRRGQMLTDKMAWLFRKEARLTLKLDKVGLSEQPE